MSKRNRSKTSSSGPSPDESKEPAFEDFDDVFAAISLDAARSFPQILASIKEILANHNPLELLCVTAYYSTVSPEGSDPEQIPFVSQSNIELVQALVLTGLGSNNVNPKPFDVRDFALLASLLLSLKATFSHRALSNFREGNASPSRAQLTISESVRGHTAAVRNSGTPEQIQETVIHLCRLFDEKFPEIHLGSSMALLWQLKNLVKQRILEHGRRVRLVLRSNSVNQLLESFCKIFGQTLNFDDCHRELNGLKLRDAKLRVRAICDLSLTKVFMIGPDDLSSERVENFDPAVFLNSWSYSINTLKLDYQQFIVRNPVWQRPLVRLAPETFLLPCIGIVDSFYLEYMESIVGPKRSQAFSDLKAAYLEDAVASVFRARLRCAELWQGFRWSNDAADGWENDLCVLLDRTLIIVESKSGKFTQLAKEGRTERLERDAGRLMGASTSQSSRLVNELESGRLVKGVDRDGRQAVLELGLLDHIIVLNVTLEHLGGLGASNTSLKDAHLAQFGSAPTMCLHELQSVGVILQEDFEFVDYLRVRDRLHKRVQYFGDELDLLALYLDPDYTLSLRGRSVESEDFVYAYGQSNALNKYFVGYAPRPVAKRTGFWGLLLNRARQMKGNWVDSTGILLSTPIKWQREFEVRASKLLAAWPKAGAHFTLRDSAVAICFLLHASMTKAERSSKIRQLSQSTQTSCGANEVLVFSIDLSTNASKDLRSVIKNAATISYWRSEMAP